VGGVALEEGVHGRDLDDCSDALLDHRGHGGPAGSQRGEEVHLHRPGEVLVAGAEECLRRRPDGTYVVDQHVQTAVLFGRVPVSAISRYQLSMVSACPRPGISAISVTASPDSASRSPKAALAWAMSSGS
jgi:hypothetical protein